MTPELFRKLPQHAQTYIELMQRKIAHQKDEIIELKAANTKSHERENVRTALEAQQEQGFIELAWVRDRQILNVLNEINEKLALLVQYAEQPNFRRPK